MNKSFDIFSKYIVMILISLFFILVLIGVFKLYELPYRYSITARFAKSGPLFINMPVYYKGYKIGHIKKIEPSEDYKYTFAKIVLYPKNPKLSEDIIARGKKLNMREDYIDLVTPDQASTRLLKNGSTIDGEAAFDVEAFLADIADSGLIIPLIQTFSDTLVSLEKTSTEIKSFFSDSRLVLKDNKQNLKQTTTNLAQSTKSLTKITSRVNNTVTEDKLNNTTSNVNKASTNILAATESIKSITSSVDCATKNLDKTVAKIDCVISDANAITSNVKVITSGLCEVLGKRFAGLRIFFGKPMRKNKCSNNCYR